MVSFPWQNVLTSCWNQVGFAQRNLLRWQRGGYSERADSKENLWADRSDGISDLQEREQRLLDTYSLQLLRERSSRLRYLETLTFLEHLEAVLEGHSFAPGEEPLTWLDVGAKNWSYVEALYLYIEHFREDFRLEGIELDGYRIYTDLYSRADYASAYIRSLPKANYRVGDVLDHHQPYDVVSCFLPFVFEEPCLAWGLPRRYFQPKRFLEHLVSLVKPGGYLLLVNQGEAEAEEQAALFRQVDPTGQHLVIQPRGVLAPSFFEYKIPRVGWCCQKKPLH